MTAKVYQFTPRPLEVGVLAPGVPPEHQTPSEVFIVLNETIQGEWAAHAARNRLKEYFESKLPANARGQKGTDYLNDLNALSNVEQRLDMEVLVFYPRCTPSNPYGFLAGFHIGEEIFSTPPDISSEANARALNILLYLALTRHLRSLEN